MSGWFPRLWRADAGFLHAYGDAVITGNLPGHKAGVRDAIEAAGASLL